MIWVTSDQHFFHDRPFIYEPRGFKTIWEMNEALFNRWNEVVGLNDTVYMLGDFMLMNDEEGIKLLKRLHGRIHMILGNHDTDTRQKLYESCWNVEEVALAARFNYKKYHFFATHYPCFTGNLEKESLKKCTCNLYGHTHQQTNFFNDIPYMYHVGVNSHDGYPVCMEDVVTQMNDKFEEYKNDSKPLRTL